MQPENVARVCHEAIRAWCLANGDATQKPWDEAEEWQRHSAIAGVLFATNNPSASDSAQHDAWVADKLAQGWVYGTTKDAGKKTHPCILPFKDLPPYQQAKDRLFVAVVRALTA